MAFLGGQEMQEQRSEVGVLEHAASAIMLRDPDGRSSNINGEAMLIPKSCEYFLQPAPNPVRYCYKGLVLRILRSLLEPEGVFFDLGTTTGVFSVQIAKHLGEAGRVYAFDACQRSLTAARELSELNGVSDRITFVPSCVGEFSDDVVDFYMLPGRLRAASSCDPAIALGQPLVEKQEVPLVALDDYCEEFDLTPDCIKVDIEGSELAFVDGARSLLASARPTLLFETHGITMGRSTEGLLHFGERLSQLGYILMDLETAQLVSAEEYARRNEAKIGSLMASTHLADRAFVKSIAVWLREELHLQEAVGEISGYRSGGSGDSGRYADVFNRGSDKYRRRFPPGWGHLRQYDVLCQ